MGNIKRRFMFRINKKRKLLFSFSLMENLEKVIDVKAKADVDHVKCCHCFGKRNNQEQITICKSKCCFRLYIYQKAATFARLFTQ
jgi:hypothetical protein